MGRWLGVRKERVEEVEQTKQMHMHHTHANAIFKYYVADVRVA